MKIFIDSDLEDQYGEQLYQEHLEKENNQMKKDITTMNKEIERLNNIINELERYINEEYAYDDNGMKIFDASELQDKLQELKGSDKE